MNIFNKIAWESLKKNKAQTFVTIIGVVLATALITGVATLGVSLQQYMISGAKHLHGAWDVAFMDVATDFIDAQEKDSAVAQTAWFDDLGCAVLPGGQNPDKPYLYFAGFNARTFDMVPLTIVSGRRPQNDTEVLMPLHVNANGGVIYKIGESFTAAVGRRVNAAGTLTQHDAYSGEAEGLADVQEKTYTVVGFYARPSFEERSAPGYTVITAESASAGPKTLFVELKDPAKTPAYIDTAADGHAYTLNDKVLQYYGVSGNQTFNTVLYAAGAILIVLIVTGAVFLIYNAFVISLNDRMHQFGILGSVGATQKQLRRSVLFEGLCIGAVGIPVGMLAGLLSIKAVLALVSEKFSSMLYVGVPLTLHVSVPVLFTAALISLISILISAAIPARRAARVPVMDCIRQTNEIKVNAEDMHLPARLERLLGVDGTLALKNYRRNKGPYRAIVLSLTLSIVLFVSANVFTTDLRLAAQQAKIVTSYDVAFGSQSMNDPELTALYDVLREAPGVTDCSCQKLVRFFAQVPAGELTQDYWQASGAQPTEQSVLLGADVQFFDDAAYDKLVVENGLPLSAYGAGSGAFLVLAKLDSDSDAVQGPQDLKNLFRSSTPQMTLYPDQGGSPQGAGAAVQAAALEISMPDTPPTPSGTYVARGYTLDIIAPFSAQARLVPEGTAGDCAVAGITFDSDDPAKTTAAVQTILDQSSLANSYVLINTKKMLEDYKNIDFIITLFTSVFVGMIALIGVANVFNTIATNIELRRRELAMLRSVGMSNKDFNRMMACESLFYGLKTLAVSLPLCLIISVLMWWGFDWAGAPVTYVFPWQSLLISVAAVFVLIFVTTFYAVHRIKKANIIEALRDEMA